METCLFSEAGSEGWGPSLGGVVSLCRDSEGSSEGTRGSLRDKDSKPNLDPGGNGEN